MIATNPKGRGKMVGILTNLNLSLGLPLVEKKSLRVGISTLVKFSPSGKDPVGRLADTMTSKFPIAFLAM